MLSCFLRHVVDPNKLRAFEQYVRQTRCLLSYQSSFFRPVFDGASAPPPAPYAQEIPCPPSP